MTMKELLALFAGCILGLALMIMLAPAIGKAYDWSYCLWNSDTTYCMFKGN